MSPLNSAVGMEVWQENATTRQLQDTAMRMLTHNLIVKIAQVAR